MDSYLTVAECRTPLEIEPLEIEQFEIEQLGAEQRHRLSSRRPVLSVSARLAGSAGMPSAWRGMTLKRAHLMTPANAVLNDGSTVAFSGGTVTTIHNFNPLGRPSCSPPV